MYYTMDIMPESIRDILYLLPPGAIENALLVCKLSRHIIQNEQFIKKYICLWCELMRISVKTHSFTIHRLLSADNDDFTSLQDCVSYMRVANGGPDVHWDSSQQEGPTRLTIMKTLIEYHSTNLGTNNYIRFVNVYTYNYSHSPDNGSSLVSDGCVCLYLSIYPGIDVPNLHFAESSSLKHSCTFQHWHNYHVVSKGTPIEVPPIKWLSYKLIKEDAIAVVSAFNNIARVYIIPWTSNHQERHANTSLITILDFNTCTTYLITIKCTCFAITYNPVADLYPGQPLLPARILAKYKTIPH